MKIKVTQTDIETGQRCMSRQCPIARAIHRLVKCDVSVNVVSAEINGKRVALPDSAIEFIDQFDRRKPVQPFEFEIDL